MIAELEKAIVTQYGTLTYDSNPLTDTAKLYADIGKNAGSYPFSTYNIVAGSLSNQDSCSDFHAFTFSINVFDIANKIERASEISDVVLEGFRNPSLSALDGTQIRIDPTNIVRQFVPEEKIWQFVLDFEVEISKTRS